MSCPVCEPLVVLGCGGPWESAGDGSSSGEGSWVRGKCAVVCSGVQCAVCSVQKNAAVQLKRKRGEGWESSEEALEFKEATRGGSFRTVAQGQGDGDGWS